MIKKHSNIKQNDLISKLLPTLDGIVKLVALLYSKIEEVKIKYLATLDELYSQISDACIPPGSLDNLILVRNNVVVGLNNLFSKINRVSNAISGVDVFLRVILRLITIFGGVITVATLIRFINLKRVIIMKRIMRNKIFHSNKLLNHEEN